MTDNLAIAAKLDEAAELIAKGWTRETYARDKNGEDVEPLDDGAVCFCSWGAINRIARFDIKLDCAMSDAFRRVIGEGAAVSIGSWNDAPERTQAEVVEAFRKAAELARAIAVAAIATSDEECMITGCTEWSERGKSA